MKGLKLWHIIVVALFLSLSVGGCALTQLDSKANDEAGLRERVEEFMQAKTTSNWIKAFDYFDSGFRAKTNRENFAASPKTMIFQAFSIEKIEIDPAGDQAKVHLVQDFVMMGYEFKQKPEVQNWIKEKGKWFLKMTTAEDNFRQPQK